MDAPSADSPIGSSPLPQHPCCMALDSIPESRRVAMMFHGKTLPCFPCFPCCRLYTGQ
jgi:hypothetical protein